MRRGRWLLALVAVVVCFALTARAQETAAGFKPVEFVVNPNAERASVHRLALTSETEGEITAVRGARPVKGTWSLVAGLVIRFLVPDGTVRLFRVGQGDLIDPLRAHFLPEETSAWLAAVARDAAGREPPPAIEIRSEGGRRCDLYRYTDTDADWLDSRGPAVVVTVTAKDAQTLVVAFPDGSNRTIVKKGKDWEDTTQDTSGALSESRIRKECLNNLSQLAAIFVIERVEKPGKPKYDGTALFLSWRSRGAKIRRGQESILRCPGDPERFSLDSPEVQALYDNVELKDPTPGLCSYAARDFTAYPLRGDSDRPEPLACCRQGADGRTPHHKGGICIAFDDGSVFFYTREKLGLAPDEPIVVGPESKSELLKKLVYIKKR